MVRKPILIIFFVVFNLCYPQLEEVKPESVGVSSKRLSRISDISRSYVSEGKVPGIVTIISRKGKIVYFKSYGKRGVDNNLKIKKNDLVRIYSMTKPITAVAAMQLYERGKFKLNDPISKFLPELNDLKKYNSKGELIPINKEITMQQLLTHTAGFTYGWGEDLVDEKYNEAKLWESISSKQFIDKVSSLPLKFEPGNKWHYSIAVDLTGVIIERLSGKTLSEYLNDNIFVPLGMMDTFFEVPKNKLSRFLPNHNYEKSKESLITIKEDITKPSAGSNYEMVRFYSGGGGLVSTAMDFMIFSECVRNGGVLNGKRILGPKTIKFMTKNHLPRSISGRRGSGENPNWDTASIEETESNGFGFGLGFGLVTDSVKRSIIGSDGEFSWGGAAGTIFWIDPIEEISVVSMIQLMGSPWPLREDLKVAIYQSLIEINEL